MLIQQMHGISFVFRNYASLLTFCRDVFFSPSHLVLLLLLFPAPAPRRLNISCNTREKTKGATVTKAHLQSEKILSTQLFAGTKDIKGHHRHHRDYNRHRHQRALFYTLIYSKLFRNFKREEASRSQLRQVAHSRLVVDGNKRKESTAGVQTISD